MRAWLASAALLALAGCHCGGVASASDAELDFGDVTVGTTATGWVTVANTGTASLELYTLETPADAELTVDFSPRVVLPGSSERFVASFTPAAAGARSRVLALATSAGPAHVTLRGTGVAVVPPDCASHVPTSVDFGVVVAGTVTTQAVDLEGGTLVSGDINAFTVTATDVTFAPPAVGAYSAVVGVPGAPGCPGKMVALLGVAASQALSCSPDPLDFGPVNVGAARQQQVSIVNATTQAVSLDLETSGDFSLVGVAHVSVAALSSTPVLVEFRPSAPGTRSGSVGGVGLGCMLVGLGGGPDIEVTPAVLAFGSVPYFANAPQPSGSTRNLSVHNRGDSELRVSGLTLLALNADSHAGDVSVDTSAFVLPPGATVTLPVTVSPREQNVSMAWSLTVSSNDLDSPEVVVPMTAVSVVLPPCQYSVTPTALSFGRLAVPQTRNLSFTIRNLSQNQGDDCLLTAIELAPGSDPMFQLATGPVYGRDLGPGEALEVVVRAAPATAPLIVHDVMGAVRIGISSPTGPQRSVPLTAQLGAGCLVVAPNDVDFGTVAVGCASSERTVTVYNICTMQQTLDALSAPAEVTSTLVPGTVVPASSSVPLSFTYRPVAVGEQQSLMFLRSGSVDEAIGFHGAGNVDGANVEVFTDSRPKVDFLLVIDDSCSMLDKQARLMAGLQSLLQKILAAHLDFHIGVTTTEVGQPDKWGVLRGVPTVLTNTTPNLMAAYAANTNVGTPGGYESFAETAVRALSLPVNSGFLRPDSTLSITGFNDFDESALMFVPQLERARGNYNVIGGFGLNVSGCSPTVGGPNNQATLNALGGVGLDICAADWGPTLDAIVSHAGAGAYRFLLHGDPSGPVTVDVDGLILMSGWTFDPATRFLTFDLNYAPPLGATVRVSYATACH